jgi:hypothetical protein
MHQWSDTEDFSASFRDDSGIRVIEYLFIYLHTHLHLTALSVAETTESPDLLTENDKLNNNLKWSWCYLI